MKASPALLPILVLLALPLLTGCLDSEKEGETGVIVWMSYAAGVDDGESQGKPVMVDFYAEWCGPCKQMDADTYQNQEVIQKIEKSFIAVKVDVDQAQSLSRQYKIEYVPTIAYLSPEGVEVHRTVGYRSASQIIADMNTALQKM